MLNQLSIRFEKAALIEMFQYMDTDRDNKLTYEDFVNLKYECMGGPMAASDTNDNRKASS